MMSHGSLTSSGFFFCVWLSTIWFGLCRCGSVWFHPTWNSLGFSGVENNVFHQIWEDLPLFLQIIFLYLSFSSPSDSYYLYVAMLDGVPPFSKSLLIFLQSFFLLLLRVNNFSLPTSSSLIFKKFLYCGNFILGHYVQLMWILKLLPLGTH